VGENEQEKKAMKYIVTMDDVTTYQIPVEAETEEDAEEEAMEILRNNDITAPELEDFRTGGKYETLSIEPDDTPKP
jgi:hypothetical protein